MNTCSFLLLFLLPLVTRTCESAWNHGNCTSCLFAILCTTDTESWRTSLGLLSWWNKVAIRWVTSFVLYSPLYGIKPTLCWKPEFIWGFINLAWELDLLIILAMVAKGNVWGHLQGASHMFCSWFSNGKTMCNLWRQKLKLIFKRQASKECRVICTLQKPEI